MLPETPCSLKIPRRTLLAGIVATVLLSACGNAKESYKGSTPTPTETITPTPTLVRWKAMTATVRAKLKLITKTPYFSPTRTPIPGQKIDILNQFPTIPWEAPTPTS